MILPIIAYGSPVLRKSTKDIDKNYPEIDTLIEDMWETLYASNGVGLAAPQIAKPIRLFIVDSKQMFEHMSEEEGAEYGDDEGVKQVFINAEILEREGEPWTFEEGCLSIPTIREDVNRPENVTIQYLDENFEEHTDTFTGLSARVIQHEYDHIGGKLFIDYLKPLKKRLIKKKLEKISKGKVKVDYKMKLKK